MDVVRIGSRESKLAVVQSEMVRDYLQKFAPEIQSELVTMKTTGDIVLDKTLDKIGGKGLFVKELDIALLEGRSDLSVHSLKDMPMEVSKALPILGFSKREDPRDVLILPEGKDNMDFSKPIGCSSRRRILQLQRIFPEATFQSVRGNVLTRLQKLDSGEYGALVLAAAGLKRLGLTNRISRIFTPQEVIPAAGQGILCLQGREGEDYSYLEEFFDTNATYEALAERAFVRTLDGGCSSPIAAFATVDKEVLTLQGLYYDEITKQSHIDSIIGSVTQAEQLGKELAYRLKTGKVWLVGAGPSDPGLFTLKGKEVLEQAEVVVYDALVGSAILTMIPEQAEKINVGKRANKHTMVQEEINQLLVDYARKGKKVVRLKGGDPFLFGRGGEELELLVRHQIPYEIVPGVTSAISVPAYNGIPVTHRDYTSSLHIITGHKKQGECFDIDFDALVRTKGTLVFLMGVSALADICKGLLEASMDPDMPAAILQQGTTANQKRMVATVSTLVEEVKKQQIETPAIIVVGKVCALANEFAWYEKLPLFGCKVMITRPKNRISTISHKLRNLGAQVLECPAIETVPRYDQKEMMKVLQRIENYHWIVFTSPVGVTTFFEVMKSQQMDIRKMHGIQIAAVGPGTKKEIEQRGMFVDVMPKTFDGESLGVLLNTLCKEGDQILIPRARAGNQTLITTLKQDLDHKITVKDLPIYDTNYVTGTLNKQEEFDKNEQMIAVFTSASSVESFVKTSEGLDLTKVRAACIGKQTKQQGDLVGMRTQMAKEATIDHLVELVIEMHGQTIEGGTKWKSYKDLDV